MIKKCLTLMKVQLGGIIFSGQFGTKQGQKATKIASMAIVMGLVGLVFVFYSALITFAYVIMGMEDSVMPLMMTAASLMILFTTMAKASNFIFSTKDNDLLMSLPVTNWAVIVSRFASLYLYEAVITAIIMVPALVVYCVMCGPQLLFIFEVVLSLLFVPLIPLAIATLIGIVISFIAARFKYKNLVIMVLGTAAFLGIMYFSFTMPSMDEEALMEINDLLMGAITRLYPPAALYFSGLNGSAAAYLGYLILSVAVAGVIIALIAWRFNRLIAALSAHKVKGNFKMTRLKTGSAFSALLAREFKRYFSSTVYVLNTALIYVLLIAAGIAVFFIDDIEAVLNLPGANTMIGALAPIVIAFFAGITSTTSAALSLEGKNLWLIASFPVRSITVFNAKIALNLILGVPCVLITAILFAIRFQLGAADTAFTIVIPLLYTLLAAVGGLFLNIHFPNFSWTNEAAVVKQGAAPMIAVFGGMILVFVPGGFLMLSGIAAPVIYGITAAILIVLTVLCYVKIARTNLLRFMD
ncbi:MAG TPA: hypothetical protein IAB46_10730 [Candidatus Scybalocola faecigallinarum]|uniref:Uncharacterized protein n=1 Tax=Candidatus Scybalocola faecigallinarum TaxID=2840941 RepID=A0A9D1F5L1_9FIRM|nr:hypothetical protein [Candidatus Scybalocola faecigallinarum]